MALHPTVLGVTPYTTREHLRRIFAKLASPGEGELVAALFFDEVCAVAR